MLNKFLALIFITFIVSACNMVEEQPKAEITSKCTLNGSGDYKCVFTNRGKIEGSLCEYLLIGLSKIDDHAPTNNIINPSIYEELYIKTKQSIAKAKAEYEPKELNDFIKLINPLLIIVSYNRKSYAISDEFCSGLVRAGDVREINGTTLFNLKYKPIDICKDEFKIWTDICYFTSISSGKVKIEIQEEFNI